MKLPSLIFYGFSIFSMFFGSGNLVFPIKIGVESGPEWLYGFAGLFITAIILPFLGLFAIKLYHGDYEKFFDGAGRLAKFFLPLTTLSLLGSFGVVPRCITVAHGSFFSIFPEINLELFSLIFCILCFLLCLDERVMVRILGKILTPLLLVFLTILIILGIIKAPELTHISSDKLYITSFENGFFTGYETMDLFAAFFFSSLIFKQMQLHFKQYNIRADIMIPALKASIIAGSLLCIIYLGFIFLGAHYSAHLQSIQPQLMLPNLSYYIMGEHAAIIICFIITLSCLTTATALSSIYARYIASNFTITQKYFPLIIFIVLSVAFKISLTEFNNITNFLEPIVVILYPGLIFLTILSIITKNYRNLKIFTFYFVTIIMYIINY